ncbi:MAG TPA: HK97 family phage prohead protease [Vicinamibacterales bacterium]
MEIKRLNVESTLSVKSDGSSFTGWASMAGILDQGGDIVAAGAFADDLRERGNARPIPWQHQHADPIGTMTLSETSKGLRVTEGKIVTEVQRGREAAALLKAGVINGLSIGYSVAEDGYDRSTGARLLKRLKLHEVSLVTFPMLVQAQVDSVKSDEEKLRALLADIRRTTLVARNDDERELLGLLRSMRADSKANELEGALGALRAFRRAIKN